MKRAAVVLAGLGLMAGLSWAETGYLVIRVNLNGPTDLPLKDEGTAGPGGGGGAPQPPPPPGGGRGGRGGRGGAGGAGGPGGGRPPGMPQPPAGGSGAGAAGFSGNTGGEKKEDALASAEKKPDWFVAALDVNVAETKQGNEKKYVIAHRWGRTPNVKPDAVMTDVYHLQLLRQDTLAREYSKIAGEKRKDEPLKVAEWLLARWNLPGAPKSIDLDIRTAFETLIDELNKDQAKLPPADRAKVQALAAAKESLRKPLAAPTEDLARLKALPNVGDNYRVLSKDHYAVLHVPNQDKVAERIHARLEATLAGFVYWFALQGKPVNLPSKQLVAVLAENENKFTALHQLFDSLPLASDGFFANFDNVMILSAQRRDPAYRAFKAHVADLEKQLKENGLSFEKLARGDALTKKQSELKAEFMQYARAAALADQAASEEGETSTLTYEAVQQLAAATGLLPRSVMVPQAVRSGLASFFATPRSASELNLPALWTGVGGPNWVYLPIFRKLLDADKEKEPRVRWDEKGDATSIPIEKLSILSIVTDESFGVADRASKSAQLFKKSKAEAEAWALTFFLAKKKLDQLRRFYDELALLPRDMELPGDVVKQAFARAFDLHAEPGKPDLAPAKVDQLEKEFREFMGYQTLMLDTAPRK